MITDSYVDAVYARDELGVIPPLDDPQYDADSNMWGTMV